MRKKEARWLNWIRQQQLDAIKDWLLPLAAQNAKVLDIGGGNGFIAMCLKNMGFDVVSIDPEPREPSYFPVQKGNCCCLEFEDGSFDVIFSSNVLEHIVDLGAAFSEMKRVLKKEGIMIHMMPTHYSMIFTLVFQPVGYFIKIGLMILYAFKFVAHAVFASRKSTGGEEPAKTSRLHPELNKRNIADALRFSNPIRLFISWPHGASPDCFTEIREWRPNVWRNKFEKAGLSVKEIIELPVTHSMHSILPFRLIKLRNWLAQRGFSVTAAYLIQC